MLCKTIINDRKCSCHFAGRQHCCLRVVRYAPSVWCPSCNGHLPLGDPNCKVSKRCALRLDQERNLAIKAMGTQQDNLSKVGWHNLRQHLFMFQGAWNVSKSYKQIQESQPTETVAQVTTVMDGCWMGLEAEGSYPTRPRKQEARAPPPKRKRKQSLQRWHRSWLYSWTTLKEERACRWIQNKCPSPC